MGFYLREDNRPQGQSHMGHIASRTDASKDTRPKNIRLMRMRICCASRYVSSHRKILACTGESNWGGRRYTCALVKARRLVFALFSLSPCSAHRRGEGAWTALSTSSFIYALAAW